MDYFIFLIWAIFGLSHAQNIAIIGAGFAGLRAARRFEELKINYTIFEGTDRVGGRVFPFSYSTGYLQYGAEYVNGVDNEIYEICKKNNLLSAKELDEDAIDTIVGGVEVEESLLELYYDFEAKTTRKLEKESLNGKISLQSVSERVDYHYQQFISSNSNSLSPSDLITLNELKNLFKTQFQLEWSAKIDDLCMKNLDVWDSGVDKEWSLNKFGFKTILDKFKISIPPQKILLNSKITNIDYSGQNVIIHVANSTQSRVFDAVIVTSSLGFLKKHKESMFTPPLPNSNLAAINGLGYGSNMKIFLEFERPWWPRGSGGIQISGINGNNFTQFDPSLWAENILVAWLAGDSPAAVAKLTDEQLITLISSHLITNLKGIYNVTKIRKIYRHNWISDEFALGSYTYISKNACQEGLFQQIASPILKTKRPVVCFAGEHTASKMYQTVVGAARSGLREANRIYEYYSKI